MSSSTSVASSAADFIFSYVSFACETLFSAISRKAAGISILGISKLGSSNFGMSKAAGEAALDLDLDGVVSIASVIVLSFEGAALLLARTRPGAGPCLMGQRRGGRRPQRPQTPLPSGEKDIASVLVQCNTNIAPHNKTRISLFRSTLNLGPAVQRGGAASFAALLVLSPSSLACSVSACICRRI